MKLTKKKNVTSSELWTIDCVKYIYESIGVYDIELSDGEFWEILNNAAEKSILRDEYLTDEKIENAIDEYIEENYTDYYQSTLE